MNPPIDSQTLCKISFRILLLLLLPFAALSQANNLCGNAISLNSTPGCSSISGSLTGSTTYTTFSAACGAGTPAGNRNDVWYSFVAKSTNPTITLSSPPTQRSIQLLSGSCASMTSLQCVTNGSTLTASGLTIGTTYLIRIFSNNNSIGTFSICITDPAPANNLCAAAITLNSGLTCSNTSGNMYGSTVSTTTVTAPNCASSATYDVWYKFVAQTTNPTITLSGIGSDFTGASMQLLSNNCGGTFAQLYCGTTSIAADFLTPGTTYLIRVYSNGTAPTSPTNADFDICVTDPVSTAPSNNECVNAVNISVMNTCSNLAGDMAGATPSATPLGGSCTGPNAYDVWYKFTAVNNTATIALSGMGTNFLNPRLELMSGTCGALTSVLCGVSPLTSSSLVPGNTYYVRVYSNTAPAPNGNARFNICISSSVLPAVRFGNSYVNITKKTTGGVVQPGDTLEIRMTIQHTSATTMTNLRFLDNIPTNTAMLTGATDRIRVITNEGLFYKEYTLAGADDPATYIASPVAGQYNIRMNLGFGGTNPGTPANNTATEFTSATGTMTNTNVPKGGGGLLFATAYRVKVTGTVGQVININPAQFIYRAGAGDVTLTGAPLKILISEPLSLCSNSIGLNNATEFGGTFGSGSTLNRPTDLTNPIAGYSFLNDVNAYNGLGDGRYAIVKNMSPRSATNRTANSVPNCTALNYDDPLNCNNRMHGGHWYIDGDHTGTNNTIGNVPPAENTSAGYMLMVNADYVASEVYTQTLNNLCPNTYYEFSAWFRNICPTCGADSIAAQFTGTPTAPAAGYPGVYPNLSFSLNGLDYYSTGEINVGGWQKKGFVFRTGATQTNATFSIRNNSQGGGGNDWVMDDIAVATCLPTMSYSPTVNPFVCRYNSIVIRDTISSFFKNYTTYKWQKSINNGSSWTDVTGVTTLADTNYYITTYTVTPANAKPSDSGTLYRVVVATTASNLMDPNCNISDGVTIKLHVSYCEPALDVNLIAFNGKLVNSKGQLFWSTTFEDSPVSYTIEKSTDGRNFVSIGEVQGRRDGKNVNVYSFTDPQAVVETAWYRIVITLSSGKKKYSTVIQLRNGLPDFELGSLVNPFANNLPFTISVSNSSNVVIELIDMAGKTIQSTEKLVHAGTSSIELNTESLPSGVYTLRVRSKDRYLVRRVIKKY